MKTEKFLEEIKNREEKLDTTISGAVTFIKDGTTMCKLLTEKAKKISPMFSVVSESRNGETIYELRGAGFDTPRWTTTVKTGSAEEINTYLEFLARVKKGE